MSAHTLQTSTDYRILLIQMAHEKETMSPLIEVKHVRLEEREVNLRSLAGVAVIEITGAATERSMPQRVRTVSS